MFVSAVQKMLVAVTTAWCVAGAGHAQQQQQSASPAGMELIQLRMSSVLGQDVSARHEAIFTLRRNGRQSATIRLPEGVSPFCLMVDGRVVKPVMAGPNLVHVPESLRVGDSVPIEVKVIYDTPSGAWGGSGRVALTPPTLGDEVPVREALWKIYTPDGYALARHGGGLGEKHVVNLLRHSPGFWETLFDGGFFKRTKADRGDAPVEFPSGRGSLADYERNEEKVRLISERLNRIILPQVRLEEASIEEAVEYVRTQIRHTHQAGSASTSGGVNLVIKQGVVPTTATISLDLENVPLLEALRYVTELGGRKYKIEPHHGPGGEAVVVVVPISDVGTDMSVRKFKVSLADMIAFKEQSTGENAPTAPANPFAPAKDPNEKANGEFSIERALKAHGIPFPDGAMAFYDGDAQVLLVKNNQQSIELVETLVETMKPDKGLEDYYDSVDSVEDAVRARSPGAYFADKMKGIIFPAVQFNDATPEEVIEFLRIKSKDHDHGEQDPAKKGVNVIMKPEASKAKITLDLKDVSMVEALKVITEMSGTKYVVEPYAVMVLPLAEASSEMYTRTFKVPPSFIKSESATPEPSQDPGSEPRVTALDILKGGGIPFPEGPSATFIPATSQIIVRNTQAKLDEVEAYVNKHMAEYLEQRRQASLELAKSGVVRMKLELPNSGQVVTLQGHERPTEFTLSYLSWERRAVRTSLLVVLGAALFWSLRGGRIWLYTMAAVLFLVCAPMLILPSWTLECSALLFGWLLAVAIWLLLGLASCWSRRMEFSKTAHNGREGV